MSLCPTSLFWSFIFIMLYLLVGKRLELETRQVFLADILKSVDSKHCPVSGLSDPGVAHTEMPALAAGFSGPQPNPQPQIRAAAPFMGSWVGEDPRAGQQPHDLPGYGAIPGGKTLLP